MTSEWGEDDKRVERGWEVGRESDVGWRRVGAVGLGHRERQEFERGMHRHVALSRGPVTGHCYRVQSQGTVTGYCHRPPITGYRHKVLPLDTITGYIHRVQSLEALPRISATDKCRGSTSQWHIKKRHPG